MSRSLLIGLVLAVVLPSAAACGQSYGEAEQPPPSDGGSSGDGGSGADGQVGDAGGQPGSDGGGGCTAPMAAGPFAPASAFTSTVGAGPVDWSSPDNARFGDGVNASIQLPATQLSRVLLLQDFRIKVPPTAVVVGITVSVTRGAATPGLRDAFLGIGLTQGAQGVSHADGSDWPMVPTARAYGGPLDTWGVPWTLKQITTSTFGVGIAVRNAAAGSVQGGVDAVTMTVHYCP